jgi:ribosomal-protein-alanine N-acetyltransferase
MTVAFGFLGFAKPLVATASPRDAATIATLHGESFRRGWGEEEVHALLTDRTVVAHRIMIRHILAGFIISRLAGDEAEILSIAIAPARRGRGLSRQLLDFHLRVLAGRSVRAVFLEVDEQNEAARHLYDRAGFREVGRRQGYYETGATALVLRRDLG